LRSAAWNHKPRCCERADRNKKSCCLRCSCTNGRHASAVSWRMKTTARGARSAAAGHTSASLSSSATAVVSDGVAGGAVPRNYDHTTRSLRTRLVRIRLLLLHAKDCACACDAAVHELGTPAPDPAVHRCLFFKHCAHTCVPHFVARARSHLSLDAAPHLRLCRHRRRCAPSPLLVVAREHSDCDEPQPPGQLSG
jgi:hypothetical protein